MLILTCRICGTDFPRPPRRGPLPSVCNPCTPLRTKRILACRNCGVSLAVRRVGSAYCSDACRADRERKRLRAREDERRSGPDHAPAVSRFTCTACGVEKPAGEFWRRRDKPRGIAGCCKSCAATRRKARLADPDMALAERLRRQISARRPTRHIDWHLRRALCGQKTSAKLEAMFGYSLDDLRRHFERQFTRGMSWEAFAAGRIHIDHRVPLRDFDLSDPADVRAAWALTNLQPMWATQNIAKGARRVHIL